MAPTRTAISRNDTTRPAMRPLWSAEVGTSTAAEWRQERNREPVVVYAIELCVHNIHLYVSNVHHMHSLMLMDTYPVDWNSVYCLFAIVSLLLLGGMTWREQSHARSGFSAAACGACSLPHLSADKVSDKTVQFLPCHNRAISVLTREVIWLRFITNTKWVREGDPFCSWIKLRCNIWHIVLCIVVCAKCAAVWEGCVWSCASSCWENVSDAYHPQVTAKGGGGARGGAYNI